MTERERKIAVLLTSILQGGCAGSSPTANARSQDSAQVALVRSSATPSASEKRRLRGSNVSA